MHDYEVASYICIYICVYIYILHIIIGKSHYMYDSHKNCCKQSPDKVTFITGLFNFIQHYAVTDCNYLYS